MPVFTRNQSKLENERVEELKRMLASEKTEEPSNPVHTLDFSGTKITDVMLISECDCTYNSQHKYWLYINGRKRTYTSPRYIDLCAECHKCLHCHEGRYADHKWKRQQVKGLCPRGQQGRECGKHIAREGICPTHYSAKYLGRRTVQCHPLSISKEERARRVELSAKWLQIPSASKEIMRTMVRCMEELRKEREEREERERELAEVYEWEMEHKRHTEERERELAEVYEWEMEHKRHTEELRKDIEREPTPLICCASYPDGCSCGSCSEDREEHPLPRCACYPDGCLSCDESPFEEEDEARYCETCNFPAANFAPCDCDHSACKGERCSECSDREWIGCRKRLMHF